MIARLGPFALAAAFVLAGLPAATAAAGPPWLFVTDVHFDPAARNAHPAPAGDDSNGALVDATLAEMQRVDPDAPVVVIGGDFLAHHFDWKRASATLRELARRFDRAFPRAQFLITLGNEDSACGDYRLAPRSAFLREVAQAWEPLVDRRGTAPAFARSFARDGFYTARLPLARTQAVVIDDVFWSPRYAACTPSGDPAADTFAELARALHASADRHWLLVHIPPGIDAFSTAHVTHRLAIVPFLQPVERDRLVRLIADPRANVTLVLAAHTHKFAYRIAGSPERPVPLLLMPSVSPIFDNAPAFLTARVDPDGTLRDLEDHALLDGRWRNLGGYAALGVSRFTGPALRALQTRLARDPGARRDFARLYESGAASEIDDRTWPIYRCAATAFTTSAFRACAGDGGTSFLTRRGIVASILFAVAAVVAGGAILVFVASRRRAHR
jgi:sphingomyelin phosphodiesterase acid-like 3